VVGSGLLARGRAVGVCAAIAVGIAGCTPAGSSSTNLTGKTLAIYVSAPASLAADPEAQDVVDAEKLAFQQQHAQVTAFKVAMLVVANDKVSENARTAISDTTHAIAYLGEVLPGVSADSLGITNGQDMLQVSPTDTAAALTLKTPAVANSPNKYYESLSTNGRTFARVVPTTSVEATALIDQMRSVGVSSLYTTTDGSAYGETLAYEVRNSSGAPSTVSSASGASGVLFAGSSLSKAASVFNSAAASNPNVKLFAPSALDDDAFVALLSPAARKHLYVTTPGLLPKQLTATAPAFASGFKSAYGRAPAPGAIYGYEAMSAVLAVLQEAASGASNRQTVIKDFFAIKNRSSPLGTYSIDKNGDTNLGPSSFLVQHVKGSTLVPLTKG
jgi:branched-chain amino acid transport system substrate-binding protein